MRKQFIKSIKNILRADKKTVLMLGDIGVFGFREELKDLPQRAYNIGILEQCTVGVAAGLSKMGMIPIVHTIAPFLIERSFEQIKIDFGYQKLRGNLISVGSSYDYASLGCTHHCPADIGLMLSVPDAQIIIPGTSNELSQLLNQTYNNSSLTYFRLSEYENKEQYDVNFGKGILVKEGSKATVICYGNMLSETVEACSDLDVSILYYHTIYPFDSNLLMHHFNEKIIICEPFYEGTTNHLINKTLEGLKYKTLNIGVPRQFLTNYGTKKEHDENLNLNRCGIQGRIEKFIYD
jgi:transketolase